MHGHIVSIGIPYSITVGTHGNAKGLFAERFVDNNVGSSKHTMKIAVDSKIANILQLIVVLLLYHRVNVFNHVQQCIVDFGLNGLNGQVGKRKGSRHRPDGSILGVACRLGNPNCNRHGKRDVGPSVVWVALRDVIEPLCNDGSLIDVRIPYIGSWSLARIKVIRVESQLIVCHVDNGYHTRLDMCGPWAF